MLSITLLLQAGSGGSPLLRYSFVALAFFVAALVVAAVGWSAAIAGNDRSRWTRHTLIAAVVAAAWMAATGFAAARGLLHFAAPPTMLIVFPAVLVGAVALALSPVGTRITRALPLAALVGFQGFRVLVELLLHRAYTEGLMPVQMSYAGRNFDIVSGATAIGVAAWLATGHVAPRLVLAWNVVSAALLANIVIVALLSAPTPMRVFLNEPSNVWITRAPWVWLPTVMVFAAVTGHVMVFRRLRMP